MKFYLLILVSVFVRCHCNPIENFLRDVEGDILAGLSNAANQMIRLYEKYILKVDGNIWEVKEKAAAEYDFIVVGAGSSGSVVAARLSEIPDWTVCVFEAGQPETQFVDIPLLANSFQGGIYDWGYTMEPQDNALWGLEENRMPYPRGKAIGGTSVLNYMIYSRGAKPDFDKWEKMGNEGWSYEEVLPYFLKSEGAHNIRKADWKYHNKNGLLSVEDTFQSTLVEACLDGGKEIGFDYVDYNSPLSLFGVSPTQSTTTNGRRFSTGRAFLSPASKRDNLDVVINALVTKILIDDETNRAYGVIYEIDGTEYTATARKEVILCAGAINTPQLLMLSGIGPRRHLSSLGIKVIKDLPVGHELMDHICFWGVMYTIYFDWDQTTIGYMMSIKDFVENGKGPFTTLGGVEGLSFIRTNLTSYCSGSPDIEFLFIRGYVGSDHGTFIKKAFRIKDEVYSFTYEPLEKDPVWTIAPVLLHPVSVGKVKLRSTDPHDPPLIYGNFYSDKHNKDIKRMIAGIRTIQKFKDTKAFRINGAKLSPYPVYGCQHIEFDSDAYWECALRTVSVTLYHPMRTCKMGPRSDPVAVVDNRLKVYDIYGLRVADASVIPFVSGHTNAPSIMIGERVADFIKEEHGKM